MKPLWQIDARDVIGFQGRDDDFTRFVNDLLAHQAPAAALQLISETDVADGGVDAAVTQSVPAANDPEKYLGIPTCWQYKASSSGRIAKKKGGQQAFLRKEIRKPEVVKRITAGCGYRLCIADNLPASTRTKWEGWLLDEARKIDKSAPPPKVITAEDLARWANRLPGMILPFRPYLGALQSLRSWGIEITELTPHFVPVVAWQAVMEMIGHHADLGQPCVRVVQVIQGEAGVGKTRCVYEALIRGGENHARVVYTTNEVEAEKIANIIANDPQALAILVADECSLDARVRLERRLQPHAARVRVLAIHNRPQDERTSAGEVRLERIAEREVEEILERHFPVLPADRLRAFVGLSGGFVRLALDLCRYGHLIPPEGQTGPVLDFIRDDYLCSRLTEEEQKVTEAVALLSRVGYRAELRQQLEWLCEAIGLQPEQVKATASRLKQTPGFIAMGERYLYITPRLIAQAAFQAGWKRWVGPDPEGFFGGKLRAELVDAFADQLRVCGTDAMREAFARFFDQWTAHLKAPDLADEATVRRLVRLIEVEPQTLLPRLRRLLEATPADEVQRLHTGYTREACRRELVWLAERFLRLPEHFADAERILLRLAVAETEVYANNARGVWQTIFRPLLSGTALPFADRLHLLEQRLQSADDAQLRLALGALSGPLTASRPVIGFPRGRLPVVAGRIPPPDWQPKDGVEFRACWTLTVDLLKRSSRSETPALREGILDVTLAHLVSLLRHGFLAEVIEILGPAPLSDARFAALLQWIDRFLDLYCRPDSMRVPPETEAAVRAWRQRVVPESLHGRLVSVVGRETWQLRTNGDGTDGAVMESLASDLLHDRGLLEQELPWLCSREARSAFLLGAALGRLDAAGALLERIIQAASPTRYVGLVRGYIQGLALQHPANLERINRLLDQLQASHPQFVFDLLGVGIDGLRPFERLRTMVDCGGLPIEFLRGVEYAVGHRALSRSELQEVMNRLLSAAHAGNQEAARAAIHVLWQWLRPASRPTTPAGAVASELRALLETTLEVALPGVGSEADGWAELFEILAAIVPATAVRLGVAALAHENLTLPDLTEGHLAGLARREPEAMMQQLGAALLDPTTGWRLEARGLRGLIQRLPNAVVIHWVEEHGRPGATVLAPHLPPPYVDASGNPLVPELTAYVLERFAADERLFGAFCAGVHSGQMYEGDIAAEHEREADAASRFLDHPLARVREWAQFEIEQAAHHAAWWRARDEELATREPGDGSNPQPKSERR